MKTFKAKKKPVVVEFMTFDDMVQYGLETGDSIVDGIPWSFKVNNHPITHCSNDMYLISTLEGDHWMKRNDYLCIGVRGEIYPIKIDIFNETYDIINESANGY